MGNKTGGRYQKRGGTLSSEDKAEIKLLIKCEIDARMGSGSATASAINVTTEDDRDVIASNRYIKFELSDELSDEPARSDISSIIESLERYLVRDSRMGLIGYDGVYNIIRQVTGINKTNFLNFFKNELFKDFAPNEGRNVYMIYIEKIAIIFLQSLKDYKQYNDSTNVLKSIYRLMLKEAIDKYFNVSITFTVTE